MKNPENTKKNRFEYWAITKDGAKREKLQDYNMAQKVLAEGKTKFWYQYIDGVRKIECFEWPCDVYEKEIITITNWKKL